MSVQTLGAWLGVIVNSEDGVHIDFLDETFYSVMCPAKDAVVTLISVVTATVNGVVQKFVSLADSRRKSPIMTSSSAIDPNFNAMFTLFATSVNTFVNQVRICMNLFATSVNTWCMDQMRIPRECNKM